MSWLIPFKGRNSSGVFNQNFLYKYKNIYVMDNHRAALWCWLDYFDNQISDMNIFHIDRHTDALSSNLESWVDQAKNCNLTSLGITQYLDETDITSPSCKLFRWDNYLSIFLELYRSQVDSCYYAVYEGDSINHDYSVEKQAWDFPENIEYWLKDGKWILNIDLDYFFHEIGDHHKQMFSQEYLEDFFSAVSKLAKRESDVVITISFSPECCGGWSASEKVWEIAESQLGTGLKLAP